MAQVIPIYASLLALLYVYLSTHSRPQAYSQDFYR